MGYNREMSFPWQEIVWGSHEILASLDFPWGTECENHEMEVKHLACEMAELGIHETQTKHLDFCRMLPPSHPWVSDG